MPILPTTTASPSTQALIRASRSSLLTLVLATASLAQAQLFALDNWKESELPAPPSFDPNKVIAIEMPRYMTLKLGVDPATIQLTDDGVVRYVVVATNPNGEGFNAFYEGLRCATAEYKSYARFNSGKWELTTSPEWKPLHERNSVYTIALAKQALCRGAAPRASVGEMIRTLKAPMHEAE